MQTEDQKRRGENVVCFTVFGDPVSKARPRTVGYGQKHVHTYTPQTTIDQERKIAGAYRKIYGSYRFEKGVPLLVSVSFFLKMPKSTSRKNRQAMSAGEIRPAKKPDTDNLAKLVTDALNGVAYEDDAQVVELIGKKYYSEEPRTEVFIAVIGDDE